MVIDSVQSGCRMFCIRIIVDLSILSTKSEVSRITSMIFKIKNLTPWVKNYMPFLMIHSEFLTEGLNLKQLC